MFFQTGSIAFNFINAVLYHVNYTKRIKSRECPRNVFYLYKSIPSLAGRYDNPI
jgi:hypothetical protein